MLAFYIMVDKVLINTLCVILHYIIDTNIEYEFQLEYRSWSSNNVAKFEFHIKLIIEHYLQDGERGYLEGLASRYADLFSTHYGDVLSHLEDLRRIEWSETSPRERKAVTPVTPPTNYSPTGGTPSTGNHGLTTSQSQPIYVPGKYSVSSL